ncbi:MAG TPA: diguanylate cyclase [Acetobacteraceae bacterium]|nr:diguanylate cyclase [Acetobacteraceae bacterium]
MESRQRWRDFGAIAADIVFEVDQEGRLSFVAPEQALGWCAARLLGRRAADLFFSPAHDTPDPFLLTTGMRHRRAWLRQADGHEICLAVSSAPLLDDRGNCIGARAIGTDVTAREQRELLAAAAVRRAEILDHILDRMRQEVLAPRIMSAMLEALLRALGGHGAAVLDLAESPELSAVMHQAGHGLEPVLPELLALLREYNGAPQAHTLQCGLQVMTCHASTRFGHEAALAVWRPVGARCWDSDDRQLIASVTALVRIVLEHEAIQRELARQARTDPLTGLLNRRAFLDEARRRIDRLEREGLPGTLMFADLDRLKQLNDRLGHEAGDAALVLTSQILRRIVRPSDLVARLGGDEFALWLDGFDELTAAERAENLRLSFPREAAHFTEGEEFSLSMSIGIACRQPGGGEELDDVIQRADQAMYEVKRNGRGHWRVSHPERVG